MYYYYYKAIYNAFKNKSHKAHGNGLKQECL